MPNDCDIIAVSFYNNHWHQHQLIIDQLLKKTNKLIVNVSEPTTGNSFMSFDEFIKNNCNPKIRFFGDAVLNFESSNFETIVSWFIFPENFYAVHPWAKQLLTQLTYNSHRAKKFDCLLGNQRRHRDFIAKQILSSNYHDQFVFSYHKNNLSQALWPKNIDSIDKMYNAVHDNLRINLSSVLPVEIYNQTWYSIVAETTTENSYNQYTEKVAKPIVAKRPFVVFAGQNYLGNLKKLGFHTFSSVIDESYDNIADFDRRMQAAWNQVEFLCKQDPVIVNNQLQDVLEHNRQHFLNTDWQSALYKHFY
jgi:hypothetical protein